MASSIHPSLSAFNLSGESPTRRLSFHDQVCGYGVDAYDIGNGFGHFGIAVDDVEKTVELIRAKGGKITREPGPVKGGSTIIIFIEDPDGYKFELLQRGTSPEPLCQVMLQVGDLNHSIEFYEKAFGMELFQTQDNPELKEDRDKLGSFSKTKEQSLKQQRTRKDQLIKFRMKLLCCSLQQTTPSQK
ncbi:hypothetical protein QN277_000750 [Acacia crassicarpa]|uniref:VOC domain-containing protein n=1 Tax=Acacia crassicarpa TaxID=499986 RepID=A0AAE1N767_9FABA|nr:hypothetical protein QN277_000750 [Acacia crassicarpa]